MAEIKRLVIDVLKPHKPGIVELSDRLADLEGVTGVNASLIEVDEEVKNVKFTMEGTVDIEKVRELIRDEGASIHSIDEVVAGEEMIDKVRTPQD